MYIAYYGRPADPEGLAYWSSKLDDNSNELANIIQQFGRSTEYTERLAHLDNETLVNEIYLQLLARNADASGLSFYLKNLNAETMTLATIALNVANGVIEGGDDAATVVNKLLVANAYTNAASEGVFSYTNEQIDAAKALLLSVNSSEASLDNAMLALAELSTSTAIATDGSKNILLIVADDIGVDIISSYEEQPNFSAYTPTIDSLAEQGVLFRNAWANPKCSPSRASLLTGRHAFRHGVTNTGRLGSLASEEESIAEILSAAGFQTALFGKWHLGDVTPTQQGFDYFSGSMDNIDDYSNWQKTQLNAGDDSAILLEETNYATEVNTTEAIDWIAKTTGPWLVEVAYNAPHSPYHVPPTGRYSSYVLTGKAGDSCNRNANTDEPKDCYRAAAETLDSFIAELLAGIEPAVLADTLIVFVGDNGTPGEVVIEEMGLPFSAAHAKGTVFEGGVNIPLIIAGGSNLGIDSAEVSELVQIQDIFSTLLALGNGSSSSSRIDGQSLLGYVDTETVSPTPRSSQFSELYSEGEDIDRWAISNGTQKYNYREGIEECFDLAADSGEQNELFAIGDPATLICDTLEASRPQ